jgi:hypothetical protein
MHQMSTGKLTLTNVRELVRGQMLEGEIGEQMSVYTGWSGIEDLCQEGGGAHEIEVEVRLDPYDLRSKIITGAVTFTFQERYTRGCRDFEWSVSYKGSGTISLDAKSGDIAVSLSAERVPERPPDEDEPDDSD